MTLAELKELVDDLYTMNDYGFDNYAMIIDISEDAPSNLPVIDISYSNKTITLEG